MIYLELFWTFFKVGLFTIGGGYAMIPMIKDEVILKNWCTAEQVTTFIGIGESTPGPFAINLATFIGSNVGGQKDGFLGSILGSLCSTFGVVLPSFIIILIIAKLFTNFQNNRFVKAALKGAQPVILALILVALIQITSGALFNAEDLFAINIFNVQWLVLIILGILVAIILIKFKKIKPIPIIIISGVLGIILSYSYNLLLTLI